MGIEATVFMKGSPLPEGFLKIAKDNDNGVDFAFAITDTPIFLFLVLQGVSQKEAEVVESGSFEIGATVVEKVPFFTLNYGNGFVFDFAIETMKELDDPDINAVNIILVEKNGYVVEAIRTVGVKPKLIKIIQDGVKGLSGHSVDRETVLDIYNKHSSHLLHAKADIQRFSKY